jgi:hypothetical protein
MGPLAFDHPLVTKPETCPGCRHVFKAGDAVTLVILGPGDDEEARERRDQGRPYNAIAQPVHWDCSTQERTP